MPDEERQNLSQKEDDYEDKQTDNLEVRNRTPASDNTAQVLNNSSEDANHNLQHSAEVVEVDLNDVIRVEELSHKLLGESSGENSECNVIYEFPNEDECKNDSFSPQLHGLFSQTGLRGSGNTQYRPITHTVEQQGMPIEVIDTKNPDTETVDHRCASGTSREAARKRKKGSLPIIQNKRHNDVQRSSEIEIEDESSENTSDEFADVEDNVKDSSSSDKIDLSSSDQKVRRMPDLKSGFQRRHVKQNEAVSADKSVEVNHEQASLGSNSSENNKPVDKTAKKPLFPPSLKGESLPAFKLSEEDKKKFQLAMPAILEARESESDEQILQPGQHTKNNSLKMKTKVGKRKDRCNVCNVRIGLCAIQCRCGGYYCARHRYDREHSCTYDYKKMGAAEIQKNNPKIVAEKVRKL